MRIFNRFIFIPLLAIFFSVNAFAQQNQKRRIENIGGPSSVGAQIQEDHDIDEARVWIPGLDKIFSPWFSFKEKLKKKHGLELGIDNTLLYQNADTSLTNIDNAIGNIVRVFGKWTLLGRKNNNPGSLVFKFENRSRVGTSIAPAALGSQIGYLGITGTLFSSVNSIVNSLYWEQFLHNRSAGFVVGRLDPTDFIDVSGYANPFTTFQNLAILLDPSIAFPNTGAGFMVGTWLAGQWTIMGGLYDANGKQQEFSFFRKSSELFTHAEIGWSPSQQDRYFKNIHIIVWHVSPRKKFDVPESYGVGLSANWLFAKKLMPFLRVGWSKGLAPFMNKSITAGIVYRVLNMSDVVGVGFNAGKPSLSILRTQYTAELFYRIQIARILAITPSVQLLIHPALNPMKSTAWLFGARARFAI